MLQLRFLGPVQIEQHGEPVRGFDSRKALALLAYLAAEGQPVPRERLVDLFWADKTEAQGRNNLSWTLNKLSTLLPGCLQADRHSVQFLREGAECVYELDLDDFEELKAQGDAASLVAAVELYQGEFLEGLYLKGCPDFELWQVREQERWRRRVGEMLGKLVAHHSQGGEIEQGLRFARRLLELEPWREEVHRGVMRLLALDGQRSAALAQYETCRRVLAAELGVEPCEATAQLYQQIQAGELTSPDPIPWIAPKHNLPVQATPFVGREAELAELARMLADPDVRLLTILGAGGMGKTRLALEAGVAQLDNFERGVFFVSLAPLQSVDAIVPTVAQAIGFSFYGGGEPRQQLLNYLRQKSMLLIMDNFEHLLAWPERGRSAHNGRKDGVDLVSDVLKTAPDVKILATSRARLNVRGEHRFQIAGMECPDCETPEGAADFENRAEYGAVRLFLQGARRARPGFELEADDFKYVSHICRLVEGMPLGILLAAAWVEMLAPEEIAAEIGQSLDFLETELRDVPKRQRSIRAVFDHSFNLLTERERKVFQASSVFRGGFTLDAAQRVTGASLRELMALVNRSLLHRMPTGRYQVHELTRQYVEEKLKLSPVANQAVRERHCAYYTAVLQRWENDLKGPRQMTALAEMNVEIENARAAWDWAVEWGHMERLDQALEGLCEFYWKHWRLYEGEAMCQKAAEQLSTMTSSDEPILSPSAPLGMNSAEGPVLSADRTSVVEGQRILARILARQADFCSGLVRIETVKQLVRQSLDILDDLELAGQDIRAEKAFVLLQMGKKALWFDSDFEQARRIYEQSLALYRAVGDRWWTAALLEHLSPIMARVFSDYGQAKQLAKQGLAIGRALGNPTRVARSLVNLGWSALSLGQFEEAECFLRESILILREIDDLHELSTVAWGLLWLGKFKEAHSLFEEDLAFSSDREFRFHASLVHEGLGHTKAHLGQYELARAHAQICLASGQERGSQMIMGPTLFTLGSVALAEQAYAEAWELLDESLAILRGIKYREKLGYGLAVLGYAARGLGQLVQAQQYLCEALQIVANSRAFMPFVLALPAVALLMADQGEAERAVELYALASRYPVVANSRWFEDVAGRHIATIAATLPPEVVTAAQERGRAREMDATVVELLAELGE